MCHWEQIPNIQTMVSSVVIGRMCWKFYAIWRWLIITIDGIRMLAIGNVCPPHLTCTVSLTRRVLQHILPSTTSSSMTNFSLSLVCAQSTHHTHSTINKRQPFAEDNGLHSVAGVPLHIHKTKKRHEEQAVLHPFLSEFIRTWSKRASERVALVLSDRHTKTQYWIINWPAYSTWTLTTDDFRWQRASEASSPRNECRP